MGGAGAGGIGGGGGGGRYGTVISLAKNDGISGRQPLSGN